VCINIRAEAVYDIREFARYEKIDLVVVGPEAPLAKGLGDALRREGIAVFGPGADGARLESSKSFCKDFMVRHGIPTAEYKTFTSPIHAGDYIRLMGAPIVVKADGLAAGKGVFVCNTVEDAMSAVHTIMKEKAFGDAGDKVVVERCLQGEEASFIAITDGDEILYLASSQDHKRIFDGDRGPNTGGMGAYSPAPVVDEAMRRKIIDRVIDPTVRGLKKDGISFRGVLYAGIMIQDGVPYVLEYNVRFGDPEAQPLVVRMEGDLAEVMRDTAEGRLDPSKLTWRDDASVCVVMASGGYPGSYEKGMPISGIDEAEQLDGVVVFHAGTAERDGRVVASGGRVLGVTATGADIRTAVQRAYEAVGRIHWEGVQYRKDIARRALERLEGAG